MEGLKDTGEVEPGSMPHRSCQPNAKFTFFQRIGTQFYDHGYRLAKLGRGDSAKEEIARFLDRLNQQSPLTVDDRRAGSVYLESALAIALQDRDAFAAITAGAKDPAWAFQNALITGDLDAAL